MNYYLIFSQDFLTNVRHEVTDVARRLGHHPSIVLWSGNNENQVSYSLTQTHAITLASNERLPWDYYSYNIGCHSNIVQ